MGDDRMCVRIEQVVPEQHELWQHGAAVKATAEGPRRLGSPNVEGCER